MVHFHKLLDLPYYSENVFTLFSALVGFTCLVIGTAVTVKGEGICRYLHVCYTAVYVVLHLKMIILKNP